MARSGSVASIRPLGNRYRAFAEVDGRCAAKVFNTKRAARVPDLQRGSRGAGQGARRVDSLKVETPRNWIRLVLLSRWRVPLTACAAQILRAAAGVCSGVRPVGIEARQPIPQGPSRCSHRQGPAFSRCARTGHLATVEEGGRPGIDGGDRAPQFVQPPDLLRSHSFGAGYEARLIRASSSAQLTMASRFHSYFSGDV